MLQIVQREGGVGAAPERPHAGIQGEQRFFEVICGSCRARD